MRICLDSKDLNMAIQREHYHQIDNKVWHGFWHVPLDEASSFLTSYNTPFRRYRWERNLKLNDKKLKLRMQEVPFIGHVVTAEGLYINPSKVQAIVEMSPPSDVAAVECLLGLPQYLPHVRY